MIITATCITKTNISISITITVLLLNSQVINILGQRGRWQTWNCGERHLKMFACNCKSYLAFSAFFLFSFHKIINPKHLIKGQTHIKTFSIIKMSLRMESDSLFARSLFLGGKGLALLAFVWKCDLLKILKIYSHLVFPPEIPQMCSWRETDSMEK